MYLKVLEILKVEPCEAVMIGDEMLLDVLLPKRLGINAILLDREGINKAGAVDAFVYNLNGAMDFVLSHYRERG
jgi:FMN phosphatase YigB (HAD superfamily)